MQTRLGSFIETITNILIGFFISYVLNAFLLPQLGHKISMADNLTITGIFTVVSIIRSYVFRRMFNKFSHIFKL